MKNTKIAIPVENGQISEHFGHAPLFYFYSAVGNTITREQAERPPEEGHGAIPAWLAENGITDVIVKGIGSSAAEKIKQHHINLYTCEGTEYPKDIVSEFLNETLKTSTNTGCCGGCNGHHHHHH